MIKYKEHNKMKQAEKSNRPSLKNSVNRKKGKTRNAV